MPPDADLVLRWMSEVGSGSLTELRTRIAWLARTEDADSSPAAAGRYMRDLSTLGHVDLDWEAGLWEVCPPTLTVLPGGDGFASLLGARGQRLSTALAVLDAEVVRLAQPRGPSELPGPDAVLIMYDSYKHLQESAAALGSSSSAGVADAVASALLPVEPGKRAAAPVRSDGIEAFSAVSLGWAATSWPLPDGLYRQELTGRDRYTIRLKGEWFHTTLADGVYLELARVGLTRGAIRWRPEEALLRSRFGRVFVDFGAPLPDPHRRALSACTGLLPKVSRTGARTMIFEGVPVHIAEAVSGSLGQTLEST